MKLIYLHSLILSTMLVFVGCVKYAPKPLPTQAIKFVAKNELSAGTRIMTTSEIQKTFRREFIDPDFDFIMLVINNQSNSTYIFDNIKSNLILYTVRPFAHKLDKQTRNRLFAWNGPIFVAFCLLAINPVAGGIFATTTLGSYVGDCVTTNERYYYALHDLDSRLVHPHEKIFIYPYTRISKIMLVSKNKVPTQVSMHLTNRELNTETEFICPLNKPNKQ